MQPLATMAIGAYDCVCWAYRLSCFPARKRKTKRQPKPVKPSKWQQIVTELRADGPAATLRYLSRLAALVGTAAGRTLRAVTVDKLHLEWIVATGEPADTAVRYGQVCTALYPPLAAIGRLMRIRRQEIRVEPNFLLQESDMRLDVRLHIAVYRLVAALIALAAGVLFMRETSESATAGNKPKEE